MKPNPVSLAALFFVAPASAQQPLAPAASSVDLASGWLSGAPLTPQTVAPLLDDEVPLPVGAHVVPEPGGDRELAPASGDPFFLGFAAGAHYPPAGERIDPELLAQLAAPRADGRPAGASYAFVMFSRRMTDERLEVLEELGARVLERHPHYTLKVVFDATRLEELAGLDFVRWIGVAKSWQKLHPALVRSLAAVRDGGRAELYINLFDSDLCEQSSSHPVAAASFRAGANVVKVPGLEALRWMSNGWQQRALEELGVEVLEYVDSIRAFRARVAPASIEQLVGLDFVQFLEPAAPSEPHALHDQSMPMVNADIMRNQFNGAWNQYCVVGYADSGFFGHSDLLHTLGLGWDFSSDGNPWIDNCGHGTHVFGTMLGSGALTDEHAGVAPGLSTWHGGYHFNAKIFSTTCQGSFSLSSAMNVLHTPFSFNGITTPKPHVQNHSWGSIATGGWFGTEAEARLLDNEVFGHGQLLCFSAGNAGPGAGSLTLHASAKNVLTVGSVVDEFSGVGPAGEISSFSSRGPAGDGRWKPNVCAVGEDVMSLLTNSSGYTRKSGTSMASPHVAGVAAQIVDAKTTQVGYKADLLAAMLMGSAIQRNNTVISTETEPHLSNYGAGRVDARRAIQNTPQWNLQSWNINQGGSVAFADFTVPVGTTRMVVCLRYHETAASSGASRALVHDFDLYLDAAPFTASNTASGDYFAHASQLDNTEIRVLNNPTSGSWRWKSWPASVGATCDVSVTVATTTGNITPAGSLTVLSSATCLAPGQVVSIDAYYTVTGDTASAVWLDTTSSGDSLVAADSFLYDNRVANMLDNDFFGRDITIGNVPIGVARRARWQTRWFSEGFKTFQIDARSENALQATNVQSFYVDGTPPAGPATVSSPTHTPGVIQCAQGLIMQWSAATDSVSGLAGYVVLLDTASGTQPTSTTPGAIVLPSSATSWNTTLTPDLNGRWFHIRAYDNCGNLGTTRHYGPINAHGSYVSNYCTSKPNSLGCVPTISASGSPNLLSGSMTISCSSVLNQKNGLLFWGRSIQATPFQGGWLCVASPTIRTPVQSSGGSATGNNCTGSFSYTFTPAYYASQALTEGQIVHCQYWMRDPGSASQTGLSAAVRFALCQ